MHRIFLSYLVIAYMVVMTFAADTNRPIGHRHRHRHNGVDNVIDEQQQQVEAVDFQCRCSVDECSCCEHVYFESIPINDTGPVIIAQWAYVYHTQFPSSTTAIKLISACAHLRFDEKRFVLKLWLDIDGHKIYQKVFGGSFAFVQCMRHWCIACNKWRFALTCVSGRHPRPLCIPVPYRDQFSICVDVDQLRVVKYHLNGCVYVMAKYYDDILQRLLIGCFSIPIQSRQNLNKYRHLMRNAARSPSTSRYK